LNYFSHFAIAIGFIFSLLFYQKAFAAANGFVAKNVQSGDNVVTLLQRYGFTAKERSLLLSQSPALRNLYLQMDVRYLVRQAPRKTELRLYDPQKNIVVLIEKSPARVFARTARAPFKTSIARISGEVRGSLMANLLEKVDSNWVASRFCDAYVMDHNLDRELSRGAKFWLTVEKKYDGPFFIRYGEVLQTSLQIRGRTVQKHFVRLQKDGGVFVSENTALFKSRPFYAPVDYLRIASLFQPRRRHPITRRIQPHLGVDFELPEGTPIYAARSGTVLRFGHNRAAGNFLVLRHTSGVETSYNHMKRLSGHLRRGLRLNAGDLVGEVGCTGYCTKAHLHFAIRLQGRMVDPLRYLRPYPVFAENLLHAKVARF